MSKLAEFKALEAKLAAQLKELDEMKNDSALQREIEFEAKLRDLLAQYGVGLKQVIAILDPHAPATPTSRAAAEPAKTRKPRELKRYKNPHTGEIVETKGGNHRTLNAWKSEFGREAVESWVA